ncbi:MAG: hypothetical protein HOP12_12420 [Candidatus Eisenbacteria bacterium]|uniref:DinB family protein n=1 Tax=Eiseniibacteriota bacterium TaxID=2212470 RepID=A0A849T0V9_UNCEI|nr:hypothetical protein [Candidatus Eisenbacteria bacterium]
MQQQALLKLFGLSHGAAHMNLEGITAAESLIHPPPAGNCINWVLGSLTPEQLAAPTTVTRLPGRPANSLEMLLSFHFHETYHVGQLGLLRRVVGRPGAIR